MPFRSISNMFYVEKELLAKLLVIYQILMTDIEGKMYLIKFWLGEGIWEVGWMDVTDDFLPPLPSHVFFIAVNIKRGLYPLPSPTTPSYYSLVPQFCTVYNTGSLYTLVRGVLLYILFRFYNQTRTALFSLIHTHTCLHLFRIVRYNKEFIYRGQGL